MGPVWSRDGQQSADSPESLTTDQRPAEGVESFGEEDLEDFYKRRKREREEEMEKFRRELARKRELRREALGRLGKEVRELREERARREEEEGGSGRQREEEGGSGRQREEEVEGGELEELRERVKKTEELEKQVNALRDVANIGRQILGIREKQVNELNSKLKVLEETGVEYEREVANVKRLRELYEERERARATGHRVELDRERARLSVAETRLSLATQEAAHAARQITQLTENNHYLTEKVATLDKGLEEARSEVSDLRIELATKGEKLYEAKSQMGLVNGLFCRVLGVGRREDLDRVARILEENRGLVVDLTAKGRIDQVASVLMDVVEGPHQEGEDGTAPADSPPEEQDADIKENLTKVWRVLIELLSHHKSSGGDGVPDSCYKSVETPRGPRMVISPSQTFIRLKDLILEKNCLVKEVGRLKMLNGHLEVRLGEQEKRLSLVTSELHKTWGVVNKLRTQHKQLHTQEQILRHELQHKRHMITEMKKELEICREQWEAARAKNSQTEEDWKLLREEFASRKKTGCGSTESGFEDEEAVDSVGSEDHGSEEEDGLQKREETVAPCERLDPTGSRPDSPNGELQHSQTPSPENLPDPCASENETPTQHFTPEGDNRTEGPVLSDLPKTRQTEFDSGGTTASGGKENQVPKENIKEMGKSNFLINWSEDDSSIIALDRVVVEDSLTNDKKMIEKPSCSAEETTATEHTSVHTDDVQKLVKEKTDSDTSEESAEALPEASTLREALTTDSEPPKRQRTTEEILEAREVRLKRLEEQCKSLFTKMSNTSVRSDVISNKLEELHQQYGEGQSSSNSSNQTSPPDETVADNQAETSDSTPTVTQNNAES